MTERFGAPTGRIVTALGSVYLVWGSTYLAIRFAIETLPPFLMAGVRFLIAGAILYAWVRGRGAARPTPAQWGGAAVVGGLLLLGGNGSVVWAEQYVDSGPTALLVATVPFWMVLLDWLRPGGRRPRTTVWLGVALGLVGIVLLVGPGELVGGRGLYLPGAMVLLAASLLWSVGSLLSRTVPKPDASFLGIAMQMLSGGALLLAASVVAGEPAGFVLDDVTLRSVAALAYLVVFGSIIGYASYVWLLGVAPASLVSTYAYVNPVIAVFLGWLLADERVTARIVVAAGIIVGAVALITVIRERPRAEAPKGAAGAQSVAGGEA